MLWARDRGFVLLAALILVLSGGVLGAHVAGAEDLDVSDQFVASKLDSTVLSPTCTLGPAAAAIPEHCDPRTGECRDWIRAAEVEVLHCLDADLRYVSFPHNIPLRYSEFSRSNLSGVRLEGLDLSGVGGDGASFSRSKAQGSNFSYGFLLGAGFQFANLEQAMFVHAFLLKSRFNHAFLKNADFHSANLRDADFSGSYLRGADFSYSSLHGAQFSGANLWHANFTGADLSGVDFSGAHHLSRALGLPEELVLEFGGAAASRSELRRLAGRLPQAPDVCVLPNNLPDYLKESWLDARGLLNYCGGRDHEH